MRVLHWVYPYTPGRGGQSIFIERTAVGFADLGHEIALIMKPQSDVDMKYIEDVFGSKAKRFHVDLEDLENGKVSGTGFMRVAKVLDGFKPDVIHLHNLESRELVYLRFYLNSKGKNIRTVCTMHDLVTLDRIVGLLESNTLAKQLDMVVAPSQFMLAKLGEIDSTTKNHFSVIYNGVPFRLVGEKSKLKPLKLLFAAELNEHKGGVYLLNAWAKIFRSFPDVKLIIAGEGAAKDFLIRLTHTLGLSKQVDFVGWLSQSQLNDLFDCDCILIVPSMIGEAFGLIAAEAAMAGVPVIAHNIGALPEVVKDAQTGFIVAAGDTQQLSHAMSRLISDPDLRKVMGKAAHEQAILNFNLENCLKAYESLLVQM